jgi:putative transposase
MFPRQRRPRPPLVLNEAERSVLLLVLNSERFADLAPAAVFAIFLDEGRYHGSVRTMYRFWAAKGLPGEHRKQQARQQREAIARSGRVRALRLNRRK